LHIVFHVHNILSVLPVQHGAVEHRLIEVWVGSHWLPQSHILSWGHSEKGSSQSHVEAHAHAEAHTRAEAHANVYAHLLGDRLNVLLLEL
jgi:hypothetical protein